MDYIVILFDLDARELPELHMMLALRKRMCFLAENK
jgi:hypothetical protein